MDTNQPIKFEFEVVTTTAEDGTSSYQYKLHKDGQLWGDFDNYEEALRIGTAHFQNAVKYNNDWGIPKE